MRTLPTQLLTTGIAALGGGLLALLHVPLAWMIGAMVATATLGWHRPVAVIGWARPTGLVFLGLGLGITFTGAPLEGGSPEGDRPMSADDQIRRLEWFAREVLPAAREIGEPVAAPVTR